MKFQRWFRILKDLKNLDDSQKDLDYFLLETPLLVRLMIHHIKKNDKDLVDNLQDSLNLLRFYMIFEISLRTWTV